MRKFFERLREIWQMPESYWKLNSDNALREKMRDAFILQLERYQKAENEKIASLEKQLADLRAIVANIREEAKRPPVSARNIGHLRSFVAKTGEEE